MDNDKGGTGTQRSGTLFGIGLGPGDPELMTLKAARILARVSVIAYTAPADRPSVVRGIAGAHLGPLLDEIRLPLPLDVGDHIERVYDEVAEAIARHLEEGRDVAALSEGDPFFFSTFIHLFARLHDRFPVEVIPGVFSPTACAALAGHPLAVREDGMAIVAASRAEADLERLIAAADATVIMKLGRHLGKIRRILDRLGLTGKALLVERVGLPGQFFCPLADVVIDDKDHYAVILIHRRGHAWVRSSVDVFAGAKNDR